MFSIFQKTTVLRLIPILSYWIRFNKSVVIWPKYSKENSFLLIVSLGSSHGDLVLCAWVETSGDRSRQKRSFVTSLQIGINGHNRNKLRQKQKQNKQKQDLLPVTIHPAKSHLQNFQNNLTRWVWSPLYMDFLFQWEVLLIQTITVINVKQHPLQTNTLFLHLQCYLLMMNNSISSTVFIFYENYLVST